MDDGTLADPPKEQEMEPPAEPVPGGQQLAAAGSGEVARFCEEIAGRLGLVESLVRGQGQKDIQVAQLHAELQQFRSGEAERRLDPLLLDLIKLHDAIGRSVSAFRDAPPEELAAEKVLKQFAGIGDDIELVLEKYEVSPFREETEILIPQRQLALRVEVTEDPAQVGRICSRLRPGFQLRERVLVKERVAVFAQPKGPDWPLSKKTG